MARTYRNRHTVPKGYVVRDDGWLFYPTCCPNKKAQRASWYYFNEVGCPCHRELRDLHFRSKVYRKELKSYRKAHYKAYSAKVKALMVHEDWENIPRFRRTSGWLTW